MIPMSSAASAIEYQGAIENLASQAIFLNQMIANGGPAQGYSNAMAVSAASNIVSNAATVPGGIAGAVLFLSGGAGVNHTTDTAANIVAAIPGAYVGLTAPFLTANANSGTVTAVAGTGVTLAGTTTTLTVAARWFQLKITNLANPSAPGAATTNTTTTTAAVASAPNATSAVIPVTASTGMIANVSVLTWVNADGTTSQGLVTAINTLNITVAAVLNKPILSGAAVGVWNPAVSLTGIFAIDKTTGVYA